MQSSPLRIGGLESSQINDQHNSSMLSREQTIGRGSILNGIATINPTSNTNINRIFDEYSILQEQEQEIKTQLMAKANKDAAMVKSDDVGDYNEDG